MTKPTYTPWYVANPGNHQGLIIEEGTGRNVAIAYDKADAPFLAAAPELLEALEGLLAHVIDCQVEGSKGKTDHTGQEYGAWEFEQVTKARAVLAKVRGEG